MAISETSLKDMALMTIDEINAKGGVNGKMLEAVVVAPRLQLADHYLVMSRGEIVQQGRGENMQSEGVRGLVTI